ncbi:MULTISPECIES: LrgB family protein [Vibrio]|uniref:LrgB family protein n=1 Tax=Vibrio algicola TaxID=2662262 RepID=A0A5Q0TIA4_9VIBR|nr:MULTISPECIES: LrgB family protein [Vibrio]MBD1577133.1 LrgB family protein [Vibrio sp. S11_S32]
MTYSPFLHQVLIVTYLVFTVACYYFSKWLHRRFPIFIFIPLVFVPIVIVALVLVLNIPYQDYMFDSHWLVWMLGPATLAFAVPVYEYRSLIIKHWLSLSSGVVIAVVAGIGSTLLLSRWFHLSEMLQRSLAMRSITTPFAMAATESIGGKSDLTAVFVVITGVIGIIVGELVLGLLTINSHHGKGAGLGACAHGAGTATAYKIDNQAGVIASLMMMLAGVVTVLLAPMLGHILWA